MSRLVLNDGYDSDEIILRNAIPEYISCPEQAFFDGTMMDDLVCGYKHQDTFF